MHTEIWLISCMLVSYVLCIYLYTQQIVVDVKATTMHTYIHTYIRALQDKKKGVEPMTCGLTATIHIYTYIYIHTHTWLDCYHTHIYIHIYTHTYMA